MAESLRQIQTLRERLPADDDIEFRKYRIGEEDFEVAKEVHADETAEFLEFVERMNIKPTERQKDILASIDVGLDNIYRKYNINKTRLSRPAMFFVKREDFKDLSAESGNPMVGSFYMPELDTILMWYRTTVWGSDKRNEEFLHAIVHERWHAESRRVLAARKGEDNKPEIVHHQSGLHIERLRKPNKSLFLDINEAITESLALELAADVINNQERGQFKDLIREQLEGHQFNLDTGIYKKQREMFERLLLALAAKNPEFEYDTENVQRRFYQAYIEGEFWKLGRIIEKPLGRGSFRLLAENFLGSEFSQRLRLPRGSKSMLKPAA